MLLILDRTMETTNGKAHMIDPNDENPVVGGKRPVQEEDGL